MKNIISQIAEGRIQEAIDKGELNNLPGEGKPLILEDLSQVPEDLRMAYKILKNFGALPEEIAIKKELATLTTLLDNCPDEKERVRIIRKARLLLARMNHGNQRHLLLEQADAYYKKILARIEKHERRL